MKTLTYLASSLILCGLLFLLTGCETTSSQAGKSTVQAAANVAVFHDGATPDKPFREIGVLKDDGQESEQEEIERKLIAKAAKMGGNAIIFDKPKQSGFEMQPFSFGAAKYTFLYRARVVVYQSQ